MLAKLKLFWAVLQKGKALANKEVWSDRATRTGTLVALVSALSALAFAFGFDLNLSVTDINDIAAGVSALVAVLSTVSNLLHVASNDAAGLPTQPAPRPAGKSKKPSGAEPTVVSGVDDLGLSDVELLARTIWGTYAENVGKMQGLAQCLAGYPNMRQAALEMNCWKPGHPRRLKVLLVEADTDPVYELALAIAAKALEK